MVKKAASTLLAVVLLILIALAVFSIVWFLLNAKLGKYAEEADIQSEMGKENLEIEDVTSAGEDKLVLTLGKGAGGQTENSSGGVSTVNSRDIVLITDVSGSMEWCKSESEALWSNYLWNYASSIFCGGRYKLVSDSCPKNKIKSVVDAEKTFVQKVFDNPQQIRIGLVDYTSNLTAKIQTKPDLTTSFYIGPTPSDCYLKNWYAKDFDDSSWSNYDASINPANCEKCKIYLRKKFSVDDKTKIQVSSLELEHNNGTVCFINGKEVAFNPKSSDKEIIALSPDIFVSGDGNVLACSVATGQISVTPNWKFDASLKSKLKTYIKNESSGWKIYEAKGCNSFFGPKNFSAIRGKNTNFEAVATIKNQGSDVGEFDVSIYKEPFISKLQTKKVPGLKTGETIDVLFSFDETISLCALCNKIRYQAKADSANIISELDENNNVKEIPIDIISPIGKDLIVSNLGHYGFDECKKDSQDIRFYIDVKNQGGEAVTEDFDVCLYNWGSFIGKARITGGIASGGIKSTEITWYGGQVSFERIGAFADCSFEVAEIDETNNKRSMDLFLDSGYDFTVNYISIKPEICAPGTYTVDVTVGTSNYGCPYAGDVDVILYESGETKQIYGGMGSLVFKGVEIEVTGDSFSLSAMIDPDNKILETNELNNRLTATFFPESDFSIDDSWTDTKPTAGVTTTIDLNALIRSNGCGGDYDVKFEYPGGSCSDSGSISGSGTQKASCSWTTSLCEDTYVNVYLYSGGKQLDSDSFMIDVQGTCDEPGDGIGISSMSIIPLPNFYEILGVADKCYGSETQLFPDDGTISSIVRTSPLKGKALEPGVLDFIDKTEAWSGTCVCCGLNKAIEMLESSTADEKRIILLSDGNATHKCAGLDDLKGTIDEKTDAPKTSAIDSAQKAKDKGIIIDTIGFGISESKGGDLDDDTLKAIATSDGTKHYYEADPASIDALVDVFNQILKTMETTYKPVVSYSYLRVVILTTSKVTYYYNINASELPAPHESKTFPIDVYGNFSIKADDVEQIQVYPVAETSDGKEIIGGLLWEWNKPSDY